MNESERDELLIRLDERQKHILKSVQDQNAHLKELNGRVDNNAASIVKNSAAIVHNVEKIAMLEQMIANGLPLRLTKTQTAVGGTSLFTIVTGILFIVGQWLGWW